MDGLFRYMRNRVQGANNRSQIGDQLIDISYITDRILGKIHA
jgi:hypothetical protein